MGVKHRIEDIICSYGDKRKYRGLVLENKLKVMLISDSSTDKSAASMDVNIGHMSDPDELPGLAHFCEHMLFLGTEKYQSENAYNKFLSDHSGASNAFTTADHTNYHFDVSPDALSGALDRFAQFFLKPLFTESAVDREVNAVDSEHSKNLQQDMWRLNQLEKSTSNPNHDYCRFCTGNKYTLDIAPKEKGISARDALLDFHKKWYSSNIMALCILGKESLEDLEEMAINLFGEIENKNVEVKSWEEHPFSPEYCKKKIYIVPVKDIRHLLVTFPFPDLHPHYKTAPGHYLGHLIGHEGPGSLLSYLKEQGWVNSLEGGQRPGAKGFAFFIVNVDLTIEGMDHIDEIVAAVFQYIKLLKNSGPQKWVFDECGNISSMMFRFKDKEKPELYVTTVSLLLHYYPLQETLSGGYILSEYKPELISSVLDCLSVDKVRVEIVAKSMASKADQIEKWYETEYKMEDIDKSTISLWENAPINTALQLPLKNEFVPNCFQLSVAENVPAVPELLEDTSLYRIWYKLDDEFNLPKASFYVELFSPVAYMDPSHANLLHIFVQLFKDSLTEYCYAADVAGIHYKLLNTKFGLILNIRGYNDKQDVLLRKIMDKLTSFKVDPARFMILKDLYVRGLNNFAADQPYQHLIYYSSLLLSEQGWSKEELLGVTDEMTVENLEHFIPKFLSSLHLEFLVHGNVTKEKAGDMCNVVYSTLNERSNTKELLPSQLWRKREFQLKKGCSYLFEAENKVHKSSAVETYFQFGQMNTHENVLSEFLVEIFNEPVFEQLRTQEQLGYIIFCGLKRANGTQGLRVIVQGDRHPKYLDSRIEAFLLSMKKTLNEMTEEEFLQHRCSLVERRKEKPKKLSHLSSKWWAEITSNEYNFIRDEVEVEHLLTITKQNVINYFERKVAPNASERQKLSVHVKSVAKGKAEGYQTQPVDDNLPPAPVIAEPMKIENISSFKQGLHLYPLMQPVLIFDKMSKL